MSKPEWIDELVRKKNIETKINEKQQPKFDEIKSLIHRISEELLSKGIIENPDLFNIDDSELNITFGYIGPYGDNSFSLTNTSKKVGFLKFIDHYDDSYSETVYEREGSLTDLHGHIVKREQKIGSGPVLIEINILDITEDKIYEIFHYLVRNGSYAYGERYKLYNDDKEVKEVNDIAKYVVIGLLLIFFVILLISGIFL
jgi:hypothetical protein